MNPLPHITNPLPHHDKEFFILRFFKQLEREHMKKKKRSQRDEISELKHSCDVLASENTVLRGYYDGLAERVRVLIETHENLLRTIQRYAQLADQLNKNYGRVAIASDLAKQRAEEASRDSNDARAMARSPIPFWGLTGWRRRLVSWIFNAPAH